MKLSDRNQTMIPMTISRAILVSGLISGLLPAQHCVVPATFSDKDAPSWGNVAGFSSHRRQQVVISSNRMFPLKGKSLLEVWFRRDSLFTEVLQPGQSQVTALVSSGGKEPETATMTFGSNHGPQVIQVTRRKLALPKSPRLATGKVADWATHNSVRISFSTAFFYSGGPLCLELVGKPLAGQASDFWPVDFNYDPEKGVATPFGSTCYPLGKEARSASAAPASLRVGSTARLQAFGRPDTPGILTLGNQHYANGINLSFAGAPGCHIYTQPIVSLGQFFASLPWIKHGFATSTFHIPNHPRFMQGRIYAQWINLEAALPRSQWTNAAGLTTSNGLELTLAATPPRLGMCFISTGAIGKGQSIPSQGTVYQFKAPVIRFVYR